MKKTVIAVFLVIFGACGHSVVFSSSRAFADECSDRGRILTLKPWYSGLTDSSCNIKRPGDGTDAQANFIWKIVLNIVDDMFQIVGYIVTGYIMYGGFLMMSSVGSPEKAARAQKTMLSAVVGLIVTIGAIAIVNLISSRIGM